MMIHLSTGFVFQELWSTKVRHGTVICRSLNSKICNSTSHQEKWTHVHLSCQANLTNYQRYLNSPYSTWSKTAENLFAFCKKCYHTVEISKYSLYPRHSFFGHRVFHSNKWPHFFLIRKMWATNTTVGNVPGK